MTQETEPALFSASIPSAKARGLEVPPKSDGSSLIFAASISPAQDRGLDNGSPEGSAAVPPAETSGRRLLQDPQPVLFSASIPDKAARGLGSEGGTAAAPAANEG